MKNSTDFRIAVFTGDGVGPEIMGPTVALLDNIAARVGGVSFSFEACSAGATVYTETGNALPSEALVRATSADAILLAAMGLPDVRYPDGREVAPQVDLRMELGLFAGVRPVKTLPGVRSVLADPRAQDLDYVIIRESTEGLFAPAAKGSRNDLEARETMLITRETSEKLFDFALDMAERRSSSGKVTCVDKANVFPAFGFFRDIHYERAAKVPQVAADHCYVDAFCVRMVQRPWDIDVAVTENMFGDILSDLGAALMGGMGYAPSADIGDEHAVFQPCHGSAPDIAGKGLANPTAMLLSAAMMLDWLGERHGVSEAPKAGDLLRRAVEKAFASGELVTCELGGAAGTDAVFSAVKTALEQCDV